MNTNDELKTVMSVSVTGTLVLYYGGFMTDQPMRFASSCVALAIKTLLTVLAGGSWHRAQRHQCWPVRSIGSF